MAWGPSRYSHAGLTATAMQSTYSTQLLLIIRMCSVKFVLFCAVLLLQSYGESALHVAATKGHAELVKLLLAAGASVDGSGGAVRCCTGFSGLGSGGAVRCCTGCWAGC